MWLRHACDVLRENVDAFPVGHHTFSFLRVETIPTFLSPVVIDFYNARNLQLNRYQMQVSFVYEGFRAIDRLSELSSI